MNEVEYLEDILDSILAGVQEMLQSGEMLPPELQELIANEITNLTQEIDGLYETQNGASEPDYPTPPITDNINLLWILAGGQPNAFVSYLREFPDPEMSSLLHDPNLLSQTIDHLSRNSPIERFGQQDGFPQAALQSSNVYGFKFDPRTKRLKVRFQSGSVYEYGGVPDQIFNLFSHGNASARTTGQNQHGAWWRGKNPSLGAALNQYIKEGGFPYKRLR